jgi:arylsulfatase A-like enzyme
MRSNSLRALALLAGVSLIPAAAQTRPNVLFVIADDLAPRLGCYRDPAARTPRIDRLAERGVVFTRAYTQFPSCGPSRISMLSGLYPHEAPPSSDTWNIRAVYPDLVTLPHAFRKAGYVSARVGKIFHMGIPSGIGKPGHDDPKAWDIALNPTGWDADPANVDKAHSHGHSTGTGVRLNWLDPVIPDAEMADGAVAATALRVMEEQHPDKTGKPLFLAVGFYRPHPPMIAPARHFAAIDPATIELPLAPKSERADVPLSAFHFFDGEFNFIPDEYGRHYTRAYHASVNMVDEFVGQLLDALEKNGLADNTIIVFTGDQGFHLGEHGHWHKTSSFEEGSHVPLIFAMPKMNMAGRQSDALTGLIDIYPTLCDLAGVKPPHKLSGQSLRPQLNDVTQPGKRAEITQMSLRGGGFGFSLRTDRYRYSLFRGGLRGVMLYDHANDPEERRNLATDSGREDVVRELWTLMASMAPAAVSPE